MKNLILRLILAIGIVCSCGSIPHSLIQDHHVVILELNVVYKLDTDLFPKIKWEPYLKQWIGWVYEPDGIIRVDWWERAQDERPYQTADGKWILYLKGTNHRIIADHFIEVHSSYDREVADRSVHPYPRAGLDPPQYILEHYLRSINYMTITP